MEKYITPLILDDSIPKIYDNVVWYVVAIWILVALAANLLLACVIYCLAKGKSFTGSYQVINGGHYVRLGCQ